MTVDRHVYSTKDIRRCSTGSSLHLACSLVPYITVYSVTCKGTGTSLCAQVTRFIVLVKLYILVQGNNFKIQFLVS